MRKIISGGQTGADRGALDAARLLGLASGGWVPQGRRAEDGRIPEHYTGLVETDTRRYEERTRLNVRDADATLIVTFGPPTGGTRLTVDFAKRLARPHLVVDLAGGTPETARRSVARWLEAVAPRVLNVAGPRSSTEPRIAEATKSLLCGVLSRADEEAPALWAPVELSSERMRLVVPHPDHAERVVEAIAESFAALHRFMEWAREIPEPTAERVHLEDMRRRFVAGETLDYFLFRRDDERFLGACGFPRMERGGGLYEIGYWIRKSETGQGLASEAVRRCTALAFEELGAQRVEIRMSDLNSASARVAERAGYRFESLLRGDATHPDGSPRDTRIYALERQRDLGAGGAGSRSEHDSK